MTVADEDPKAKAKAEKSSGGLWDTVKIVLQALILALLVRTFLFQPFSIPSGSMEDTLLVGDFLFVSKYSYGYSRYSFPFSPGFIANLGGDDGRIWEAEPERGDIVVFKWPYDDATDYIKRVIGLPGDRIQMIDGVLNINGTPVQMERLREEEGAGNFGRAVTYYRETLPNGVSYEIRDNGVSSADNTAVFVVPDGQFFMMGDNRDNSSDSRVPVAQRGVGFVPFENLIGRAEIIFFSVDDGARAWEFWRWPWTVRTDRLFRTL
ncbi:MAG: signal peptidase I [Bauldia sp.]|nr:signal peptidase I [Bauldia sp.]